ncbi:MAG: ABC transporter ATP-binding protein [Lachnospirales bacterium]
MNIKNKISLKNISLQYNELLVLDNINFSLPWEKITCILGPSGCGKTSLLNIIAGLNRSYTGEMTSLNEPISYIFQEDRLLEWETVYSNISLVKDVEDREKICTILKTLDLYEFKDKYPKELSGGMRQRVSLGRGFYYTSNLLLLDEPLKSLDYDLKLNLINYIIENFNNTHCTMLYVTHDIEEALTLGDKIIILSKRPTTILKEFEINIPKDTRDIYTEELISIRKKIINLIT